ncbi:Ribokinase-like protein [Lactifluus volemus]|nr:Ribokinase-like protein [Lactifluus volemus]
MAAQDLGRVLSIQSHVTYGYVGGKAATFPLQLLGYDVDLDLMFSVLEQNGFLKPARILSGFIFGAEALSAVARSVTKLLRDDPQIIYLLDPVIGDAGQLYVLPNVIPIYRSLLPKATIITPNWFEVEQTSLQKALTILHETYCVPNVVISSIPVMKWVRDLTPPHISSAVSDQEQSLLCLASVRRSAAASSNRSTVYAACVPLIPGYFSGVGDLFSALDRTVTDDELDVADPERRTRRMRGRELRLVQGRTILSGEAMGEVRSLREWDDFWA